MYEEIAKATHVVSPLVDWARSRTVVLDLIYVKSIEAAP